MPRPVGIKEADVLAGRTIPSYHADPDVSDNADEASVNLRETKTGAALLPLNTHQSP